MVIKDYMNPLINWVLMWLLDPIKTQVIVCCWSLFPYIVVPGGYNRLFPSLCFCLADALLIQYIFFLAVSGLIEWAQWSSSAALDKVFPFPFLLSTFSFFSFQVIVNLCHYVALFLWRSQNTVQSFASPSPFQRWANWDLSMSPKRPVAESELESTSSRSKSSAWFTRSQLVIYSYTLRFFRKALLNRAPNSPFEEFSPPLYL